ncbi:glycerol-3-phosphate phosphatase-like [Saccoglossus kowalevskii]|uniref:Phosphoglycolate phosphatase-like n=1 Tax=Saccoglossus kowalevskii TaxID=10224 RepID=A0ABM0MV93_SACKO|nr:PREDICTED: phosphoglycolate phosphatase-like [Saccoglossus kowalevskii]
MAACAELNSECIEEFLSSFNTVLVDCDGVLWCGEDNIIEGSRDTLVKLRMLGKRVIYFSNNSTKSRSQYQQKLHRLGFEAELNEIICATSVCCQYIKDTLNIDENVYLVGSSGFIEELDRHGIKHFGSGEDPVEGNLTEWTNIEYRTDVKAVLVGFDAHFNYMKIMKAANYLRNPNCYFLTNGLDFEFPLFNNDRIVPAAGCFVLPIQAAAKRKPTILGKPNKLMFEAVKQIYPDVDATKCIIIGDRLDVDIEFGKRGGGDEGVVSKRRRLRGAVSEWERAVSKSWRP